MLTHVCGSCGFKSTLIDKWIDHLWEIGHLNISRNSFLKWDDEDNFKSLVVYAPSSAPPPKLSEVIALFLNLNFMVVDFVSWIHLPRVFVVQFVTKEEVDTVIEMLRKQSDDLKIGDQNVQMRRKSDVLQYEWDVLINSNGSSGNTTVIELSDDSPSPSPDDGGAEEEPLSMQNGSRNSNQRRSSSTNGRLRRGNEENEEEPSSTTNGNGRMTESDNSSVSTNNEDVITEDRLVIKMSSDFATIYQSKVKQEKGTDNDDKRKVRENMVSMAEKWADIYVAFHDKVWPVCFFMMNSDIKCNKISSIGLEARFKCECLNTHLNTFIKESFETVEERNVFVAAKVNEFYTLLLNETECNRRMKELKNCRRRKADKPLLNFASHVLITFNNGNDTKAELTFTQLAGKNLSKKLELVKLIFKKLFKKYEKMKIQKWSSGTGMSNERLEESKSWTQLCTSD